MDTTGVAAYKDPLAKVFIIFISKPWVCVGMYVLRINTANRKSEMAGEMKLVSHIFY